MVEINEQQACRSATVAADLLQSTVERAAVRQPRQRVMQRTTTLVLQPPRRPCAVPTGINGQQKQRRGQRERRSAPFEPGTELRRRICRMIDRILELVTPVLDRARDGQYNAASDQHGLQT